MTAALEYELQLSATVDETHLDEMTRQLVSEIRSRDVETVTLKATSLDVAGSKSGEAIVIGAILVKVLPATLPILISFLKEWCMRTKDRSIKIVRRSGDQEIELAFNLDGIAKSEIDALIDIVNRGVTLRSPDAA